MNFSDYTLVSFGDSFTLGQGTYMNGVLPMEFIDEYSKKHCIEKPEAHPIYKSECNKRSYTAYLEKKLGFKSSANLGEMGASNERIFGLVSDVIQNRTTDNIFLCINLTSPNRHDFMQAGKFGFDKEIRHKLYILRNDIVDPINRSFNEKPALRSLDTSFWEKFLVYLYTSEHVLHNHMKFIQKLHKLLTTENIPYIMFDGLNDIDHQTDKYDLLSRSIVTPQEHNVKIYREELGDVVTDNFSSGVGFYTEYKKLVKEFPHYLDYYTLNEKYPRKIAPLKNVGSLLVEYGAEMKFKRNGITPHCGHWEEPLHKRLAEVLTDYINDEFQ